MGTSIWLQPIAISGLALLTLAQDAPPGPALSDLSGTWTLNRELSDDAGEKMRENAGRRGRGRPGPGAPFPGAPPPGMDDAPEGIRAVFEPAEELFISVGGAEVEIEEAFGRTRLLRPNGRTYKTENGLAELRTRWEEGELRIETKRGRQGKVEETWTLGPDRNRIEIQLKLDLGRGPDLKLRRVYDRAPEDDGG